MWWERFRVSLAEIPAPTLPQTARKEHNRRVKRTAEFDAFGPWLVQVQAPEGLPRLYRDHPLDFGSARMVLKVPRNIQRRDANPDMHLYDYLLVAGGSGVTVLSRRGDVYDTAELPYERIAAVRTSVSMLDGLLRVYDVAGEGPDGVGLEVPYNGVSDDLIRKLARIMRSQALASVPGGAEPRPLGAEPLSLGLDDLGRSDIALVTAQREFTAAEGMVPCATHLRTPVRRGSGAMRGFFDVLRPVTLHAGILATSPGEVHLVHRRPWVTTGRKPVHSVAHTVVIVPRVEQVEVIDSPRYQGVRLARIISGRSVVVMPFPEGADTGTGVQAILGARAAS